MSAYHLTWITDFLAAGYAPMSYDELESIKLQGIDAIVNLCGEFHDLHLIEKQYGFDVYYLPLADETAPDMKQLESCVEWIDESIFLGKKVLVHCHHGIGRTGTVVTAYLLRKGLDMKVASARLKLKKARANPVNYAQWNMLRKYGRQQGVLSIREPSLEGARPVELGSFFRQYESLFEDVERAWSEYDCNNGSNNNGRCGLENHACCLRPFNMFFMECVYVMHHINRHLSCDERRGVLQRAGNISLIIREAVHHSGKGHELFAINNAFSENGLICPLNLQDKCILYDYRPLRCRYAGLPQGSVDVGLFRTVIERLSNEMFFVLSGAFPEEHRLEFLSIDAFSGRFVEKYFAITDSLSDGGRLGTARQHS
jgi:hypothetical protein